MAPDNKKRPSKLYRLFDSENGFFRIMAVVFDLIELNVLTLLCCVPIVTAGASFTAMHNTLWHMVRHEEGYVHTHFFRAFKENFKQATVVWLVCLAIIIVMLGDISIMGQLPPVFHSVLLVVLVVYGAFSMLFWAIRANFDENIRWCVKMTLQMLLCRPLCTLCLLVVFLMTVLVWLPWPGVLLAFGLSLPVLVAVGCVYFFGRIPGLNVRDTEAWKARHPA